MTANLYAPCWKVFVGVSMIQLVLSLWRHQVKKLKVMHQLVLPVGASNQAGRQSNGYGKLSHM